MDKNKAAALLIKVGKMIDVPPSFWDYYQPESPNTVKAKNEK